MRWRVQLGINSTSDVWKFCQNWTSRRGEFLDTYKKLDTYFNVLLNVNIIFSRQSSVLPDIQPKFGAFVCIFINFFAKAKFGAFVRIFISFLHCNFISHNFVFKIPFRHFVCFGKIINCTAVQLMK